MGFIQVEASTQTWQSRLSSLPLFWPWLWAPPAPTLPQCMPQLPQLTTPWWSLLTLTSPQCTPTPTPSRTTTASATSTPMRLETVTTPMEDTRSLFPTAEPRLLPTLPPRTDMLLMRDTRVR